MQIRNAAYNCKMFATIAQASLNLKLNSNYGSLGHGALLTQILLFLPADRTPPTHKTKEHRMFARFGGADPPPTNMTNLLHLYEINGKCI